MLNINLKALKELVQHNTGIRVEIEKVYADYGTRTMHTTLVAKGKHEYQILNPKQVEVVQLGIMPIDEAQKIISEIVKRGW